MWHIRNRSSHNQDVTRGIDTSLTLKLQKRVTELEQDKQLLRNELENREEQLQRASAMVPSPIFTALTEKQMI